MATFTVLNKQIDASGAAESRSSQRHRWLARTGNLVFYLLILALVGVAVLLIVLPRFVQFQPYVVLTGSMTPTIPVGSIVIAVSADPRDVRVGDVISFTREQAGGEPTTVTHRVSKIIDGESRFPTFETKGDANPVPDADPVRYLGPAGKVIGWVPSVGQFFLFGRTQQGKTLLLMVPGVLFSISLLWTIWKPSKPAPQAESAETAGPVVAPEPRSPFAVELLARAYALLGDPSLTVERRFTGLEPLIKRAERADEPEIATWLESRRAAMVGAEAAVPSVAAGLVPASATESAPAGRGHSLRQALRRTGVGAFTVPATEPARTEAS